MNLLYLSYWGINEHLTVATVLPHINILKKIPGVESVVLCTLEREAGKAVPQIIGNGHIPIRSGAKFIQKAWDFYSIPKKLAAVCKQRNIQRLICRGALAGSLGYLTHKMNGVSFYVESFEPHADYMRYSGTWQQWGFRYRLQKHWEEIQKKQAAGLITVTEKYARHLIDEGNEAHKIKVAPCAVDGKKFKFKEETRILKRRALGFGNSEIVGIYVGKFGGIYLEDQAFEIFNTAFQIIENFKLILLSSSPRDYLSAKLKSWGIKSRDYFIGQVSHQEVNSYLCASDFAFCLHRSHKYSMGFSPVKNGEYWANGLPVLIGEDIGDDSERVSREGGGAVYYRDDEKSVGRALTSIGGILKNPQSRSTIPEIAKKHRSFYTVKEIYEYFLCE